MASGNAGHRTHVLCGRHEGRTWGPEAGGPAQLRAVRTWQCQRAVPCTKRAQAWRLKAAPICHFHSQGLEVWLSWSFVRVSDGDNPGVAPCAFIWRSAGGENLLPSSFGGWQDLCPWGCVTKDPGFSLAVTGGRPQSLATGASSVWLFTSSGPRGESLSRRCDIPPPVPYSIS